MFLGHVALGMAAKRPVPRVSLAVLILAAQFADVVWPLLVAVGVEQVAIEPGNTRITPLNFISYPYSHSLMTLVLWGIVVGYVFGWSRGRRAVPILAALVISHWVLDVIAHRPDMPILASDRTKIGLGLWNSIPGTMLVEFGMYSIGLWIYLRSTKPLDGVGRYSFAALAAFLPVVYLANVFGPPPPTVNALWIAAFGGAMVLTVWAWWADRHRTAAPNP
jgi:hypothetical protein